MAEGRRRDEWAHTANLMALLANINRDPKKRKPFTPVDFFPFAVDKVSAPVATATDKAALAAFFGVKKKPKR